MAILNHTLIYCPQTGFRTCYGGLLDMKNDMVQQGSGSISGPLNACAIVRFSSSEERLVLTEFVSAVEVLHIPEGCLAREPADRFSRHLDDAQWASMIGRPNMQA